MKISRLKQSIILKIIIANSLLILVLGILLLFNNNYIKAKLIKNQYNSNLNYINYISNLIEKDLNKIDNTAALLQVDNKLPTILNYNIDNYNINLYEYNKALLKYEKTLPYYSRIYIYFNETDLITSSDGIRNRKIFNNILHKESTDFTILKKEVLDNKGYTVYNNFILYSYPYKNLTFLIKINKNNIERFLTNSQDLVDNKIVITDKINNIFATNLPAIKSYKDIEQYSTNNAYSLLTKNKENLNYNIIYSNNPIEVDISHTNIYTFILFFIMTGLNTLFIIYNTYLYRPIKKIVNTFSPRFYDRNKNELDQISDIINSLHIANNNLINKNKYLNEHEIFLQLLHNKNFKCNTNLIDNLNNKYSNYIIITNIIEDKNGKRDIALNCKFDTLITKYKNFEKIIYSPNIDSYIISSAGDINLEKILFDLFKLINIDKDIFIRCGISNIHNNITEINQAIEESVISINKNKNNMDLICTLCYFSKITDSVPTPLEISIDYQQELINSLLKGNINYIDDFFNNVLPTIIIDASFEQVKNTYRYLYNLLYIIIYSKQMKINKIKDFIIINLNEVNNIGYINKVIHNNYSQITYYVKQHKTSLYEKIIDYINTYYNKDLCLTTIANHFSISTVYLSTYFKKNAGITINNYINSIKIKHAKNIIRENRNLNINQVAEQLGYINIGTFIRHFKKYTGYTPNQYKQFL